MTSANMTPLNTAQSYKAAQHQDFTITMSMDEGKAQNMGAQNLAALNQNYKAAQPSQPMPQLDMQKESAVNYQHLNQTPYAINEDQFKMDTSALNA
mmetsp:Transcript_10078/g.16999  ORF Transcript_10078/g.16999 Transcript_10078/m.16999 type:complete len:96 (+) Transcript_10078:152-439(+)